MRFHDLENFMSQLFSFKLEATFKRPKGVVKLASLFRLI